MRLSQRMIGQARQQMMQRVIAQAHRCPERGKPAGRRHIDLEICVSEQFDDVGIVGAGHAPRMKGFFLARTAEIGHEVLTLSDGRRLVDVRRGDERVEIVAGPLVGRTVADVERELILNTLKQCRGNRTSASSILGISVRTMRNKIRSFVEAGIPVQ